MLNLKEYMKRQILVNPYIAEGEADPTHESLQKVTKQKFKESQSVVQRVNFPAQIYWRDAQGELYFKSVTLLEIREHEDAYIFKMSFDEHDQEIYVSSYDLFELYVGEFGRQYLQDPKFVDLWARGATDFVNKWASFFAGKQYAPYGNAAIRKSETQKVRKLKHLSLAAFNWLNLFNREILVNVGRSVTSFVDSLDVFRNGAYELSRAKINVLLFLARLDGKYLDAERRYIAKLCQEEAMGDSSGLAALEAYAANQIVTPNSFQEDVDLIISRNPAALQKLIVYAEDVIKSDGAITAEEQHFFDLLGEKAASGKPL